VNFELASLTNDGEIGVFLALKEFAGSRAAGSGDESCVVVLHRRDVMMLMCR
jgi:hypothetical protein